MSDPTEEDYYRHIIADLQEGENPSYEHVMTWAEFKRYKAAMLRWLDEQEREWREGLDQMALEQEHDEETDGG